MCTVKPLVDTYVVAHLVHMPRTPVPVSPRLPRPLTHRERGGRGPGGDGEYGEYGDGTETETERADGGGDLLGVMVSV